jgi:hypothetical protein
MAICLFQYGRPFANNGALALDYINGAHILTARENLGAAMLTNERAGGFSARS